MVRSSPDVRIRVLLMCFAISMLAPALADGRTFWSRGHAATEVGFTRRPPSDFGRWKAWLKVGPGKASALRGSTDVVPARDRSATRFARYDQDIRDEERVYEIPSALMHAVIQTESDFDPAVVSSAGARGLMQLMPDTARLMGVGDPFDPRQSIMGGARYLQLLARLFCGLRTHSVTTCSPNENVKVRAAYHAGPRAVEKYGGMPPYQTTHAYVQAVLRRYEEWSTHEASADR
jgi:soluble lytic murein transglycosylase-like protein